MREKSSRQTKKMTPDATKFASIFFIAAHLSSWVFQTFPTIHNPFTLHAANANHQAKLSLHRPQTMFPDVAAGCNNLRCRSLRAPAVTANEGLTNTFITENQYYAAQLHHHKLF
jgi:hypothetical protein